MNGMQPVRARMVDGIQAQTTRGGTRTRNFVALLFLNKAPQNIVALKFSS